MQRYLVHIHGRNKAPANTFGTSHQQDAAEFWGFLIETLHDETNTRRNISDGVQTCYEGDPRGILEHTQAFWEQYSRENRSIIDHYFGGIHVQTSRCKACNFEVRNFVWMPYLNLTIPAGGAPSKSIESLLQAYCVEEDHKDLKCAKCGNAGRLSTWRIARLPDRLVIFFNRFDAFGDKVHDLITFPMHGLRLDQWFVEGQDRTDDRHYNPQSDYDLYAVVHHAGASLKSGHYIAFAKDHNSANDSSWFELNDQVVTDRTFATATELWSRPSSQQAYMVFYQRRNT